MTKEQAIKAINALPEVFIKKAYVLDLVQQNIQMNYNSDVVSEYEQKGIIDDNGYYKFVLKTTECDWKICMT